MLLAPIKPHLNRLLLFIGGFVPVYRVEGSACLLVLNR
jgi:hypothetical protein